MTVPEEKIVNEILISAGVHLVLVAAPPAPPTPDNTTQMRNEENMSVLFVLVFSWGCNTAAARHHERTCIDMDVIVVQAALAHIFDRQVFDVFMC